MSTREPSSEPPKTNKRKGTRSVSTLTPTQLARKRANDREAQRAIRARTKEHIERLERELSEYKTKQTDDAFQKLIKRNKELEHELSVLRQELCLHQQGGRCHAVAFDIDGLPSVTGHGVVNRPPSFGQGAGDYGSTGFPASYLPTPEPCQPCPEWAPAVVSVSTVPVSSTVSSPSSSAGPAEDFGPYQIPTSVPPLIDATVMPPASMAGSMPNAIAASMHSTLDTSTELKYEEIEAAADQGYPNHNVSHPSNASYLQQPHAWPPLYQTSAYYTTQPAL